MNDGLSADSDAATEQAQPETRNAERPSAESTEPMARENDSPDDDVQRAPSADTPDDAATQSTETPSANEDNRSKVRDILGSFLFRGDEVDKYVKVLSGGERNRLALAKMLLQPFNVLVMDEPTNHLDIKSKNVLKQALQKFEGTLILVSHDRDFLQGLTDRVYEFKDGGIKEYLGDIDFYLEQRKLADFRNLEKGDKKVAEKTQTESKENDYQTQKKMKSLKNKLSGVEKRISQLEKDIADIDHDLLMDYDATIAKPGFFDGYQGKKKELETLMEEWEDLSHELESL